MNIQRGADYGEGAPMDIPPDVLERLVSIWTDILVADFERRHGVHDLGSGPFEADSPYHLPSLHLCPS